MCRHCDGESPENNIWKDGASGDWYIEFPVDTNDGEDWLDTYLEEYINYCPYCGRKLDNKIARSGAMVARQTHYLKVKVFKSLLRN